MGKVIYNSPSNHGVGQNKCRHKNCYEDKHTKPIALKADKLFEKCGFKSIVADDDTGILNGERTAEANKAGADLYITYHTNAFSDKKTRYLLFMCYRTDGEYRKLFNCVKKHMKKIYDGEIIFKATDELYEINDPNAMTLYCEFGFHTNQKDCDDFIHNPDDIAEALVKGVCDYYGVNYAVEPFKVKTKGNLIIRKKASLLSKKAGRTKKGHVYTIVDVSANGKRGKLKSGAGWITITSKYCSKV